MLTSPNTKQQTCKKWQMAKQRLEKFVGPWKNILSLLWLDKKYRVKYSRLREFPRKKPKGTLKKKGRAIFDWISKLESSYGQCIILWIFEINCSIVNRVIVKELILSISLPKRAIFYFTLPRGYISQYTLKGKCWVFCVLGNTLGNEGDI